MLEGKVPPGERVIVFDCEGYYTGAGIAEKLAGDGFRVEIVTPFERVAPVCDETLEDPWSASISTRSEWGSGSARS